MTVRIVRLAEGAPLLPSLSSLVPVHAGSPAWLRAVGRLSEAELRASDGRTHALRGDLLLVSLEGSTDGPLVALVSQQDALGTRLATGELVSAVLAAPMDVCVLQESSDPPTREAAPSEPFARAAPSAPFVQSVPTAAPSEPSFARAIEASAERPAPLKLPSLVSPGLAQAIPQRPARPHVVEEETLLPDAGDRVEHFAFGTCEVLKSDGDRLHLKLGKNGTIKEIAIEMLRVSPLPDDGASGRRFKLERRL